MSGGEGGMVCVRVGKRRWECVFYGHSHGCPRLSLVCVVVWVCGCVGVCACVVVVVCVGEWVWEAGARFL